MSGFRAGNRAMRQGKDQSGSRPELTRYDLVARILHWSVALLVLVQLALGLGMNHLRLTDALAFRSLQCHRALGMTILLLVGGRIIWRLAHRPPAWPASRQGVGTHLAAAVHGLLYGFQILMPATGYALACLAGPDMPLSMFGLFDWPLLPLHWTATTEAVLGFLHKWGSWSFALLIAGHAAAALYHAVVRQDDTWQRMGLFARKSR